MLRHRLAILAAAVLWSTAGAAIKLSTLNAWQVSAGRSLFAAVVLFALLPGGRRALSAKGWGVALAYAATVVLFVVANKLTTAANAIFLQDAAPLYVLLLSPVLLEERPSRGEWLSAPVFLFGLSLFFLDQLRPGQLSGNLVAVASGVAFALCIMGLRGVNHEGQAILVWGNLLAGVGSLVPALLLASPVPEARDWGILVFLGVFQLGLSYALFHEGLKETRAAEASLLILLEPVLNPVWTFLFAGEVPGPWALGGGAVILAATVWRTAARSDSGRPQPVPPPGE